MSEAELQVSQEQTGVASIMERAPATTTPERPVEEVALELIGRGLTGMPVLDRDGALVGIVSEYDVIAKRGRTVGDVMSRGVVTASEAADAAEIARLMGLHGIRLVPIVREGRLVGVVSRADLVRRFATTRWVCQTCGAIEHGLSRPDRCPICGGNELVLEPAEG